MNKNKIILEQVVSLQKEAGKSQELSIKCSKYEKQIKEYELSTKKLNYYLKRSEDSRADLTHQLEIKNKEANLKEK